jgi:hypothetical protein
MATKVHLTKLPQCNFCPGTAHYDGATIMGPWAYMCDAHFADYGVGLGTGRGQELVVGEEPERDRHAEAREALEAGDWDAFEDAVGDEDPIDFM